MGEPRVSQRRQDGHSIVELLVAVTVFALVFAAVSIGIGRALELNRGSRNRSAAAYLAARQLEVRSRCVQLGRPRHDHLRLHHQQLQRALALHGHPGTCALGVAGQHQRRPATCPATKRVRAGLQAGHGHRHLARHGRGGPGDLPDAADPAGRDPLTPNDGAHPGQAFDRDALPLAGQTVSLTGRRPASQTTTSDGCAFFPTSIPAPTRPP